MGSHTPRTNQTESNQWRNNPTIRQIYILAYALQQLHQNNKLKKPRGQTMPQITIKLSQEAEERLREHNRRKGDLSRLIEELILTHLTPTTTNQTQIQPVQEKPKHPNQYTKRRNQTT
jgi:hypothetical protein